MMEAKMMELQAKMAEVDPVTMPVETRWRDDDYVKAGDAVMCLLTDDPALEIEVLPEYRGTMIQGRVVKVDVDAMGFDATFVALPKAVLVRPQKIADIEVGGTDQVMFGMDDLRFMRMEDYECLWAHPEIFWKWVRGSVTDGEADIPVWQFDAAVALEQHLKSLPAAK